MPTHSAGAKESAAAIAAPIAGFVGSLFSEGINKDFINSFRCKIVTTDISIPVFLLV